jgi:hypothetical protein
VASARGFGSSPGPTIGSMRTGESGEYSVRVVEQDGEITLIEVTFHNDGSRWRSNVATSDSNQAALEGLVQSLLGEGEFESAFDPHPD